MNLSNNYLDILKKVRETCSSVKRNSQEITLVAITKGVGVEEINNAIKLGIKNVGENRIQEAEKKFPHLLPIKKHLVGHLQCNKVKKAVQLFDCIQSVDSLRLAKEIDKRCKEINKTIPVMIEINISGEQQKHGFKPEQVFSAYTEIKKLENLEVIGLMGIAPNVAPEKTRPYFRKLRQLNEKLNLQHLSMGMSQDFVMAIEEGSTMIRIGRALFR